MNIRRTFLMISLTALAGCVPVCGQTAVLTENAPLVTEDSGPEEYIAIGDLYYFGDNGYKQDYSEAVKWYVKAANMGDAEAWCILGDCYNLGYGVTQDDEISFDCYYKAAQAGNVRAKDNVAWCYGNGAGTAKDDAEALKWFLDAEETSGEGDAFAELNIGSIYYSGRGVSPDAAEAFKWYQKAAGHGSDAAQYNIGAMYLNGEGVEADEKEARVWFEKAAAQGYQDAVDILNKMGDGRNNSPTAETGDVQGLDNGENSFLSDILKYSWDSNVYSYEMRNGYPEVGKTDGDGTWTFAILDWTDGIPDNLPLYTIDIAKDYYTEKDPSFPEGVFISMEQNKPNGFEACNGVSTGVYYTRGDSKGVFSHVYGISGAEHTFVLALTFTGSQDETKSLHDRNYEGNDDLIEKELSDILDTLQFVRQEEYQNIQYVDVFASVG